MITGIDYILYTTKSADDFIQIMKSNLLFWDFPHIVIDREETTTDIFISKNEKMFQLMDEKGFFTNRGSGEGPFLIILNDKYSKNLSRITLVLPKCIEDSKFCQKIYNWIESIAKDNFLLK